MAWGSCFISEFASSVHPSKVLPLHTPCLQAACPLGTEGSTGPMALPADISPSPENQRGPGKDCHTQVPGTHLRLILWRHGKYRQAPVLDSNTECRAHSALACNPVCLGQGGTEHGLHPGHQLLKGTYITSLSCSRGREQSHLAFS